VWRELQLEHNRIKLAALNSAQQVVEEILKLKEEVQSRVITLLYLWWSERCGIREGETPRGSLQMAQLISSYVDEFSVLYKKHVPEPANGSPRAVWNNPPIGVLKLSCDGAFRQINRSGGWGFVFRDHEGSMLSSGYGWIEKVLEPAHAEIIACLQATQRAIELGIQKIILETDAAAIVKALMSNVLDRSSASGLLWELKDLLASNFVSRSVAHNPRSYNMVAHRLAALGADLSPNLVSVRDNIPSCTKVLVAKDLASVIS
jgi:ribonuclease HI